MSAMIEPELPGTGAILTLVGVLLGASLANPAIAMEPSPAPAAEDTTEEKLYYYVELSAGGAAFRATLNDIPLFETTSSGGAAKNTPVNVDLVGENNQLHIVAGPAMRSDSSGLTSVEDARLSGSVRCTGRET
jgi:hypothetical protein